MRAHASLRPSAIRSLAVRSVPALSLAISLILGMDAEVCRASVTWKEIDVDGGNAETRKIANQAVVGWSRIASVPDLDGIIDAIGGSLVQEGWGHGEIEASIDSISGGRRCRIHLAEIAPTRLESWTWDPDSVCAALPRGAWTPARGEDQVAGVLADIQERGHPFASIQIVSAADTTGGLSVRARVQEGRRFRLVQTLFEGRGTSRVSYLERVSGLRKGDLIRPSVADDARDRLERTGLFAEVEGPWLSGIGDTGASLLYRLTPLPQNRIEGAAGYDGKNQTLSGFVHLDLGNLFGTGRHLNASWDRLNRSRSSLSLAYREPYLAGLPIAADFALSQSLEDTTWTADRVSGSLEGDLGGGITARLGLTGERTVATLPGSSSRTGRVATIFGLAYDGRSEAGTRGSQLDFGLVRGTLKRTPHLDAGEGSLTTITTHGERNFLFGRLGQIRVEEMGGWVEGPDSLPLPEAIGVGGAASLRGYPEEGFRTLGYALGRLEGGIRLLPEGNRLYVFVDGAVLRPYPSGAVERRTGYGFGVRVRGAGGWVHLDYGIPSGAGPLAGRIHFRLETRF
jgi:hypothetical protein